MNLNSVNIGMNKYCGPAVLSILTGKSTDECASVISSINGRYNIEGVQLKDLIEAAARLGFDSESIEPAATLFGTLVRLANRDGLYIVTVTGHFVAIEVADKKIYFCDNHTKEPMPAASSARLQQTCKAVHRVTKRREPVLLQSKYVANRDPFSDYVNVSISREYTYDMEKHNRTVHVITLKFKTEEEFDEFISQMKGA